MTTPQEEPYCRTILKTLSSISRSKARPAQAARRETVLERVARHIESLVRSGDLVRGSRLPSETRLAEMLQVSRASLREALKGMVFLGLLKARAGDGTYLQPSLSSMASRHLQWMLLLEEIKYLELYELRELLEPAAAALAARRATREDRERMRTALEGMKHSIDDAESFIRYELEFHDAITVASKNGALQSTMQMMYGALTEGRHITLPLVPDLSAHCVRHEHIFKLISAGDATGARRAVIVDVRFAESLLRKTLKNLDEKDEHLRPAKKAKLLTQNKTVKKTAQKVKGKK
ncbi:MAG: FCD domain-containing protein [Bryocella sp.]